MIKRGLLSCRHDQVCFLIIPSVTESEFERWRIFLLIKFTQAWLIMLFEQIDRAEINAKKTQIPLVRIEVCEWNARIVLDNQVAVIGNEIADRGETILEQQIRRRLQETRPSALTLAKLQK